MKLKAIAFALLVPCLMSFLYIQGWIASWSFIIWILLILVAVYFIGRYNKIHPYRTAFLTGMSWGIVAGLLQYIFSETLLLNNKQLELNLYEAGYKDLDYVFLVRGPMFGLIFGVAILVGVFFYIRLKDNPKRQSI